MTTRDTIYALSSGRPPAGVAAVRLSGPNALKSLSHLAGSLPQPRVATLAPLRDEHGNLLDRALVLAFPAPNSFTGEDVAEFHLHGGAAVIAAVLDTLARRPGHRLAEPGEFSRRAFDNGKLDLTQAEGLADLIAAETEAQRRQALAQSGGRLRDRAEDWRLRLLALQARTEADLDFSDETDVADATASPDLAALAAEIAAPLDDNHLGERLRDGFTIAVVGPPNVGKSSLINALSGRDAAIVTDVPGTTRDIIEVPLTLAGVPITLIDTAGLRDSTDPIEAEGMRRARTRAAEADLVLLVYDANDPGTPHSDNTLLIANKIDLVKEASPPFQGGAGVGAELGKELDPAGQPLSISAKTGEGLDTLRARLHEWATTQSSRAESALITQRRHRLALIETQTALTQAAQTPDPVLHAEHLRLAARALGMLTGRVGVEEMLDSLFGRFCIGK